MISLENIAVALYDTSHVGPVEDMMINYNLWKIKKDRSTEQTYELKDIHLDIDDVFRHAKFYED